jgi:hypothetical protein
LKWPIPHFVRNGLTCYLIHGVPLDGAGETCSEENVIKLLSNPSLLPLEWVAVSLAPTLPQGPFLMQDPTTDDALLGVGVLYNEENVQHPPDALGSQPGLHAGLPS